MPVETRYFRSDTIPVNEQVFNYLHTERSETTGYLGLSAEGIDPTHFYFRVWKRAGDGTQTELTSGWTLHSARDVNDRGSGIVSADWTCPATPLVATDSIVVGLRVLIGYKEFIKYWATPPLNATELPNATWTIYLYTLRDYEIVEGLPETTGRIWFDTATYDSRIANLSWTAEPAKTPPP